MQESTILESLCRMVREEQMPVFRIAVYENGKEQTEVLSVANDCNNIYSISKNFTAAAIGILFGQKKLTPEDSVYDILSPQYPEKFKDASPLWKEVRVSHVLTQTTGHKGMFLDMDCDDIFAYGTSDFLLKVLNEPFVSAPGTRFAYTDSNYYLLSRILSAVTGERLQEFADRTIFRPLQIQGWAWSPCPDGYAMGGTRLFLRVEDMLHFGRMLLDGGVYRGQQILPESFVETATSPLVQKNSDSFYGYSFWKKGKPDSGAFHCGGMYGQKIFVDRSRNLVVAWQAYDKEGKTGKLLNFLYSGAKPADSV